MSADLYSDLTIGLGMKNYPKMTPHMPQSANWFQSYTHFFFMSADLHTDLTIELVMKNYPKMTPHMSKSLHWIKSYVDFSPKLIKLLLQMWLQTSVWELVQIRPRPAARKVEARLMRFRALCLIVKSNLDEVRTQTQTFD